MPDFETARERYGEILRQILAYADYCEIVERMSTFEPRETGDEFLDAFCYRPNFAVEGGYFTEFLRLNFKDAYDPRLFERCEQNGEITELGADEITQILWGERGER